MTEKGLSEKELKKQNDIRYMPDYNPHEIRKYLTEEQNAQLDEFRKLVEEKWADANALEKKWLTDQTLCRFLRARDWKNEKALKMIMETLQWRRETKPWALTWKDVEVEMNNKGKMYRNGFDKHGRPVLWMKPRHDNTVEGERQVKVDYLAYIMEKCSRAAEANNREKIFLIIDFEGFGMSLSSVSNLKTTKQVLGVLQNHFPERLGFACLMNPPWFFSMFWKIVSPFLDDITKSKIKFYDKNEALKEYINLDQLEAEYGGENTWTWDFETTRDKEDIEFPPQSIEHAEKELHKKHPRHKKGKKHRDAKKKHEHSDENHSTEDAAAEDDTESQSITENTEDKPIADTSASESDQVTKKKSKKKLKAKKEEAAEQ